MYLAHTPSQFGTREFLVNVSMDIRVLAFTCLVCIGAGMALGLGPALQASRTDLMKAIAGASAAASDGMRSGLRHWIVIPQICFSLVLMLVASGFVRDLLKTELRDPGYSTEDQLLVDLEATDLFFTTPLAVPHETPAHNIERTRMTYRRVLAETASLPNIESSGLTSTLPFTAGRQAHTVVSREEYSAGNPQGHGVNQASISSGYFETAGIRLLSGRYINERDLVSQPLVAVVSESVARALWPGQNPIGRYIARYDSSSGQVAQSWFEVVGVVRDVKPALSAETNPVVYFPLDQQITPSVSLIVKAHGTPGDLKKSLKMVIAEAGSNLEITNIRTMKDAVGELLYPRRMITAILVISGLFGLFLATIGVYGVVSYSVARRTREIGIRAALGAQKQNIMSMVIGEGAKVTILGSTLGTILALAAARIVSSLILPLPSLDVVSFLAVLFIVGIVVLTACYVPARRAAGVDPMKALREL